MSALTRDQVNDIRTWVAENHLGREQLEEFLRVMFAHAEAIGFFADDANRRRVVRDGVTLPALDLEAATARKRERGERCF